MIVLYFDSSYFKWGELLISSIRLFEPEERVHVYGTNLSKEQQDVLRRLGAGLTHEKIKAKGKELSYQIIERKAQYLLNAFDNYKHECILIMLDADMVLLKPLAAIKNAMINGSFDMAGVYASPEKICGGFYIFRRTGNVLDLLGNWDKHLMDGNFFYDKDQPSLAVFVRAYMFNRGLKFLPVPRTYLDHFSREESIIWSAHKSEFGGKNQRYKLYVSKLAELTKNSQAS